MVWQAQKTAGAIDARSRGSTEYEEGGREAAGWSYDFDSQHRIGGGGLGSRRMLCSDGGYHLGVICTSPPKRGCWVSGSHMHCKSVTWVGEEAKASTWM